MDRRRWIAQAGGMIALAHPGMQAGGQVPRLTVRDEFPIARDRVYLNNASVHPMSTSTRRAVEAYFKGRNEGSSSSGTPDVPVDVANVKALFAALIARREQTSRSFPARPLVRISSLLASGSPSRAATS